MKLVLIKLVLFRVNFIAAKNSEVNEANYNLEELQESDKNLLVQLATTLARAHIKQRESLFSVNSPKSKKWSPSRQFLLQLLRAKGYHVRLNGK